MKHLKFKRGLSIVLVIAMFATFSIPVFAAEPGTEKEEVVYINLEKDGSVNEINVVNILTPDAGDGILDYGSYQSVRNMTTTDQVTCSGDTVSIDTSADKLYYEGKLDSKVMPWSIQIRYYLDGTEYSSEEIAGKSGGLEIKFVITENKDCKGDFYENYALQAAFTLNTEKCKNISAEGATVANVGKNKQLSYTILPGKGIDTTITADVTDFEMDAVSVNGVKLSLNVEIDDAELMDQVRELLDAQKKLNDGATELNDNTGTLTDGGMELSDGADTLHSGAGTLDSGIATLQNGISEMQKGINTLNKNSKSLTDGSAEVLGALETIQSSLSAVSVSTDELTNLVSASSAIKQGINDLYNGVTQLQSSLGYAQYKAVMSQNGLDIDSLKAANEQTVIALNGQITQLQETLSQIQGVPGYEEQVAVLQGQIAQLQNVITLLGGNNAAISGTETYLNTVSSAAGELYAGLETLNTQYAAFDNGINQLARSLTGLLPKLSELSSGINTLVSKYSELDSGIVAYTEGVAAIAASYTQIVDGVSSLAAGSSELLNGTSSLKSGTQELYNGLSEFCDGVRELQDGTNELYNSTDGMDEEIQDKIDEILASIGGEDTPTISFVSDKNTNIKSVQFVLKTPAIEKEEIENTITEPEETLNFWQKLLKLFGLYD